MLVCRRRVCVCEKMIRPLPNTNSLFYILIDMSTVVRCGEIVQRRSLRTLPMQYVGAKLSYKIGFLLRETVGVEQLVK